MDFIESGKASIKSNTAASLAQKNKNIQHGMHLAYETALRENGIQIIHLNSPDQIDYYHPNNITKDILHEYPKTAEPGMVCNYCSR